MEHGAPLTGVALICIAAVPLVHDKFDSIVGDCKQTNCEQVSLDAFIAVGMAFVNDS